MNKIFKVVWSKSKNCYVVVSEFAKNNSGKKKIVVATIFAALAMSNASISMASNDVPSNLPATAVGLGPNASVKGDKAVGFGYNAAAAGGNSVVIGSNSSVAAGSPQGIAIGGGNTANEGARVIGEQAIAIGGNTLAKGHSSIVIGGDDVVKADGVKVIYTTSGGATQIGDLRSAVQSLTGFDMRTPMFTMATAGESGITLGMKGQSGNVGIAIGTGANAKDRLSGPSGQANNDVTNAIAIGTGARANRDNAIAIGGGSNTDVGGTKQSSYTLPNNVVASWAGGDKTLPGDVVSFGSKGYERQLKHVAPGEVSATSTDAINGSQLSAIVDQIAYKYISIKSSDVANKDNTGATADNSIAIGPNAATDTSASRSVAVGDGARGKVVDGVAVGSKSIADIASGVAGYNVNASRTDIYAGLSGAALTSKLGGVAVGTINQTRQINYVAAGTADTDAVNVAQLKSVNLAFTGDTGTGDVNLANSKLAVNGDNTYISTTANGKKITVSGKKQDITVANGSATASAGMADSANVANAINQAIDQNKYGWNLSANGEATPVAVEKGNTVDFSGDDNVAVARNDKKISVALKKDLSKLNSASFNNASGNETVKIDGDKGINAGNLKVANVADGVADKDAVNVSQLKKVDDKAEANKTAIDTNKTAIAKNVGDITTNKTDIATNKNSIAANTQKIADNKTAIDKNTGEIATNRQNIADNKAAITKNTSDIATNKDNIATNKANIDKNMTAIARKISLGGNSGSTDEKSLSTGDVKFNVKGENGLTTVANGDDVTVKLDDATKGKVDNAADRDLSNLTPDGKQQVKDLAAWNVVANNEMAEKVEGGNTVKFIDGDNISITQNGKDFTISTKKDVTFDTVTATQTITAPKVKATTGVETPQVTGLTNAAWTPGQTQPVSGRAATEDQLKHVDDQVAENKANIADNTDKIGKNADAIADNKQKIADNKAAIDKNAVDIAANKTDIATNKDNIADNKQKIADNKAAITKNASEIAINKADIATNKDNIDKNTTAIARKISLGGNSGSTDEKSLSTGDVKFNVKGENGLTTVANGDDVTVKLDDTTKGKIENAADQDLSNLTPDGKQQVKDLAAWNVVANNETAEKVEGGNTVKFIDGDNISITQNGKDFTISTKKDVTFDTVTATQTITAPKVKATTGVETPQVTGLTNAAWTPGQTQPVSGRAATEDQLKQVDDQVAENKANIADNTAKIGKNADAIADNKQKIADNKTAIDKNAADITTNKDNIADNKQKIADNKTAIDKNTGDIATNKADISTNKDNIAINKANIDKNTTAIGRKISLGGNSGSTDEKSLSTGDVKFNVKGENGLTTVANGDDVTVKLDDTTKGKIDNAADQDLSNLTPDGKQQVKDLSAWNVVANDNTAQRVEGGNTVKFIDGDNISITQNGKDFTISTKKDVTFDTVTATQTITAPKVKATTGVETPQVTGLTNAAWTPGQTQPVSGRAATEDQLKHVDDQVAENKANIADNTDKIGKNADAIADNKQKIADNKAAIDKNAVDIATNKDNIAANKTDIATNKDNIADNKQKIADNKTAITKNTDNIATNRQNIADNKAAITKNASDIVTNKDNIATNKANIDKNTTAIGRKISLGGNSGSTDEKSLSTGDVKFNVKGENGLTTVANGDDVTVKLDDATKGKVDNAADRDLSNLTPDGKQQVKDLAAWNVVANNEMAEKVEGGNTVKFIDGDNISITQNGKDFTISTKKDVTFDTVTATQTITAPKVKATTGVETPQVTGLTNAAWTPGQTQPVSGRAATEDQLKQVDDQVAENKANIADNTAKIGKNADAIADNKQKIADNKAAIDRNAADIATNRDNISTNKQNIADNKAAITKNAGDIAANKANIDKNTEAIGRKISLGGNTGSTDAKSLSTGDVKFNIKGQNGIVTEANGEDVTVKLDDATANKINNAANTDLSNLTDAGKQQVKDLSAWNVVANGNTAEKVEGGNTVKFIDGDNISITQNGKDFTIATKQDVTFNTVKANQTITAPKVKATEGVETPQVTGLTNTAWTPGQTQPVSGRAATEDQLKHVDDQVAENKANIADNTDKIGKNADAIADNKQKIANNKAAIDRNAADIATNKDNIAVNKQNIADNKAAITKNTSDIATNKDNIATNKANIDKNTTAIARKISLGGNSGLTDEKSLSTGDVKFNIKGENGLTTIANGEDVTVKIDDQTKAKIDNAANQDLSNLTETGKQQVNDISAWKVTAAGGTVEKVQGGDTVKFQAGDNLVVNQDRTTFTYGLAKDLKGLNSVTVGDENGVSTKITPAGTTVKDAAGNSTTINGGGMTITPVDTAASPVSLTVDGLNNGGNKIHGVAPGTADTDAVNVSQLKASNAGLQEAVNRVGTETQRVGAHAAAMAALKPIQYDPLEPTQIMAGIGNYRGETAGAIGIAHYRTEDTMFNVGVSLGTSHNMVNAGVTHKFGGSRERKDAIPERYKAGPISSVYVMQDEVSSLKKENSNQKTVIANQAARLNTLEAENERQRQELAETKQGLDDLRAVVNQLLAAKG
ncbi:ESPR-type extended signal peptide-containing protein [Veillonella parvula]